LVTKDEKNTANKQTNKQTNGALLCLSYCGQSTCRLMKPNEDAVEIKYLETGRKLSQQKGRQVFPKNAEKIL
jgi:hypothetical protein